MFAFQPFSKRSEYCIILGTWCNFYHLAFAKCVVSQYIYTPHINCEGWHQTASNRHKRKKRASNPIWIADEPTTVKRYTSTADNILHTAYRLCICTTHIKLCMKSRNRERTSKRILRENSEQCQEWIVKWWNTHEQIYFSFLFFSRWL